MLKKNIINNNLETYNITLLSEFKNLENIKNYGKLEISLL